MTQQQARKIATISTAVQLIHTDQFGDMDMEETEAVGEQNIWLAKSLLKRYGLGFEDLQGVQADPVAVRNAVMGGWI